MAVVDAAIAAGSFLTAGAAEGAAAGIIGGAAIGAGTGALYSGITGDGNVLNSALTGALIGGAYGGIGAAAGLTGASGTMFGQYAPAAGGLFSSTPALVPASQAAQDTFAAAQETENMAGGAAARGELPALTPSSAGPGTALTPLSGPGSGLNGAQMLGYGLAGSAALSLLGNMNTPKLGSQTQGQNPAYIRPYQYAAHPTNNYPITNNGLGSSAERTYFNPTMTAQPIYKAATGGLTPNTGDMTDFMSGGGSAFPMSQQDTPHYATPSQMPTSAQQVMSSYEEKTNPLTGEAIAMAEGGVARFSSGGDDFSSANDNASLSLTDMKKLKKKLNMTPEDVKEDIKKEYLLDLMANPITPRAMPGSDIGQNAFEKYQMSQAPTGAAGRISATRLLDDGSSLRAGLSGTAMALPGKQGIAAMPGSMDVGYNTRAGDGNLDLSAFRSINPIPGRGHAQGLNARYTLPFAEGGAVTIHNVDPQVWNQVDNLVSKVASAPSPAPYQAMGSNPAVKAYNDAIMAKAAQTYAVPAGQAVAQAAPQAQQGLAPQGYQAPQAPTSFDSGLLDQWRAANPQSRAYNAATQTYGAGIPSQAQYDAFKAQKDQEAADAQNRFMSFGGYGGNSFDGGAGGGAAGGLPRDFAYATGGNVGNLGGYSDGGRMLKGPGDGMSDNIPASIGGKQPARLADGEFVVPADVVSHLGNGSTDAGAKRLYAMMDNVRKARTGNKKQGKQIKAEKYLPT